MLTSVKDILEFNQWFEDMKNYNIQRKVKYYGYIEKNIADQYENLKSNLEKGKKFYSFNSDGIFELDFGSENKLSIKTIKFDPNNCEGLEIGDFVFNKISYTAFNDDGYGIDERINKLNRKRKQFEKDLLKGKRNRLSVKKLNAQIDNLINFLNFTDTFDYWIELYRVSIDGRLNAQGYTNFQNIDKELRDIIFPPSKFSHLKHK